MTSVKENDNAKNFILKRRKKIADIWEDIFKQYFDKPEKFKADVNKFINSRNHIAHNMLITCNTYNAIISDLDDIEDDFFLCKKYEKKYPGIGCRLIPDVKS